VDVAALVVNVGLFIASAGAAAIAWWQAVSADRAKKEARRSEDAALQAQHEASAALTRANEIAKISQRAPFAAALTAYGSALLQTRLTGGDVSRNLVRINSEHTQQLTATGLASGEDTTRVTSWVAAYAAQFPIDGSFTDIVRGGDLVDERLRRWIHDPDSVMAEILDDPRANMTGYRGFETS
jgi:hypothetical protein